MGIWRPVDPLSDRAGAKGRVDDKSGSFVGSTESLAGTLNPEKPGRGDYFRHRGELDHEQHASLRALIERFVRLH